MINLNLRCHPDVLFSFSSSNVQLILRVENKNGHPLWAEADISVPEHLSLAPSNELRKGRVRVGIVEPRQFLEKAVKVYSTPYANPQVYRATVTLYAFNKDGVIESRLEKHADLRCEMKKEESF